jgi:DNA-binding GntR family transcriptional regulator
MLKHRGAFDAEHRALLAAIEGRDPERAAELLDSHLAGACDLLVAELRSATAESVTPLQPARGTA